MWHPLNSACFIYAIILGKICTNPISRRVLLKKFFKNDIFLFVNLLVYLTNVQQKCILCFYWPTSIPCKYKQIKINTQLPLCCITFPHIDSLSCSGSWVVADLQVEYLLFLVGYQISAAQQSVTVVWFSFSWSISEYITNVCVGELW